MRKAIMLLVGSALIFLSSAVGCSQQLRQEREQCNANTQMTSPKYRIAVKRGSKENNAVILFISIEPAKTDRKQLVALACSLGSGIAKQNDLQVWIFNSYKLAKSYNLEGEGNSNEAQMSLCGIYTIIHHGATAGQELVIRSDPKSYYLDTRVDLGQPPKDVP